MRYADRALAMHNRRWQRDGQSADSSSTGAVGSAFADCVTRPARAPRGGGSSAAIVRILFWFALASLTAALLPRFVIVETRGGALPA